MAFLTDELQLLANNIVADAKAYPVPVDTGALRDSLVGKVNYISKSRFGVIITENYYGIYVDKGTYKMKARPYLTTAIANNLEKSFENITKGLIVEVTDQLKGITDKYKTN